MHFELNSDIKSQPSTGVVKHPKDWLHGGYVDIQNLPSRDAIINLSARAMLCGFKSIKSLKNAHWKWVETALKEKTHQREPFWPNSVAAGSHGFIEKIHGGTECAGALSFM